jgi:hypothetical protein
MPDNDIIVEPDAAAAESGKPKSPDGERERSP